MDSIIVNFKKTDPAATIPQYAKSGDAGMDLIAVSREYNRDHDFWEYGTGLAMEIPIGFVGLIYPRSSISKYNQRICNGVPVIDCGYRGEIKIRMKADGRGNIFYQVGDKIAQLMIVPFPCVKMIEVQELSETERGSGGFGSSGS